MEFLAFFSLTSGSEGIASHIYHVSKIFIKDELTLIINLRH